MFCLEIADCALDLVRCRNCSSSENHSVNAKFPHLRCIFCSTDPATKLNRYIDRIYNCSNCFRVCAHTASGSIQVDNVKPCRTRGNPTCSDGNRIIVEDAALLIVALHKANTLAAEQVYGRNHFHRSSGHCPTRFAKLL